MLVVLLTAVSAAALAPRVPLMRAPPTAGIARAALVCTADAEGDAEGEPPSASGDWRDLRARLVAQERLEKSGGGDDGAPAAEEGFVFESPLIEQGAVILGGTQQEFGFALRQQYFHKSVMLLLQHNDSFTRASS